MKKFLIIASLPYIFFIAGLISLLIDEITPLTYSATSNADYVCNLDKESFEDSGNGYNWTWQYDCLKERSGRFYNFVKAYNREPLKNHRYAEGDKGGCDVEKLYGWKYEDDAYDLVSRQSWINACTDKYADTFAEWEESKIVSLEEATKMNLALSYESFNYLRIVFILLPPFIIFYLLYRFKSHVLPKKGESLTNWLKSQKKFRLSLIISILLFLIPFMFLGEDIYDEFTRNSGNIGEGLFLLIVIAYPLLVFISARFVATSKD